MIKRCSRCSLPGNFPGANLDESGVCQHCRQYDAEAAKQDQSQALQQLQNTIAGVKQQSEGQGAYDCIVALSGGKDSSYMLIKLVQDWGLRCLAITVDNGFLSEQSILNSRLVCDHVGADFILLRPQFAYMKKLYQDNLNAQTQKKAIIKRASDICNSCINLINAVMLKEALGRNVAMIAGGYIAGQVPKHSSVMKLHLNTLRDFAKVRGGQQDPAYFATEVDFKRFSNGEHVHIMNPFLALTYNEAQILEALAAIGWQRPNDTGAHSSNCRINDVGILNHQKKYGFHPYEQELAEQVRSGNLDRDVAIAKIEAEIDQQRVAEIIDVLQQP